MRLIDADALVIDYYDDYETKDDAYTYTYVSTAQIDSAPTIEADRPKGEWIDTGKDKEHLHPLSARWYRCSVCGLETNAKTNYCFNCGADMRGAGDES